MGNSVGKIGLCLAGAGEISRRHDIAVILGDTLDEGLGHSFCYVRPDRALLSNSKVHSDEENATTTTFRSISGASVSANTSTPLSTALIDVYPYSNGFDRAAKFESSTSFASIPLQPVPRSSNNLGFPGSGPIERGFLSGPIERGFVSGPIDRGFYSGPVLKECDDELQRSFSHGGFDEIRAKTKKKKRSLMKILQRAISNTIVRGHKSIVAPIKGVVSSVKQSDSDKNIEVNEAVNGSIHFSSHLSSNNGDDVDGNDDDDDYSMESQNLQWAQGKAGEDRVHLVISEEHGWVFVGIFDGFNGPDAPDYLLSNLYSAVHKELKGLLWNDKFESSNSNPKESTEGIKSNEMVDGDVELDLDLDSSSKRKISRSRKGVSKEWEKSRRRWKCEWNRERVEIESKPKDKLNRSVSNGVGAVNHSDVLEALSVALRKTEDSYLGIADMMVMENPELALMGSCVLVMLMKGDDVYLMNVGDSRAVLAQKPEPDIGTRREQRRDLDRINEETIDDLELCSADECYGFTNLTSLQLTVDHSTYVKEEVERIKNEHPDDASAIMNDRVKGYLKVTRAFGAGFLKQPKWNDALLEMFRIDYVGTSPYITCLPTLHHHKLSQRDRFLILSSDGLYQYFTNEEAVSEVELFISSFPEGDPAQHLIEEVLFRAARKAGMDFHELLDIPQGERRRYHDDVSIIVISLEGRIWRSSV
ncbi:hypothetical protein FEM48_Zijuj11G0091900 [Ziziphus jujuba var. spinosa]|uniref:protein-serine/threonine phosphatase n=1 Tax=Ziziphus jujuba var. spinosa TaxID=714518 RepID=A0A978UI28_ZIZJJ|nr:hypothetical protein FEM48_Zijuj11G0091900 [Ziziphus jujuba var. spinosa]